MLACVTAVTCLLRCAIKGTYAGSIHPKYVVARHACVGGAHNQNFCRIVTGMQVAAIAQWHPADGFGFDFGQFAPKVRFDVGSGGLARYGGHEIGFVRRDGGQFASMVQMLKMAL